MINYVPQYEGVENNGDLAPRHLNLMEMTYSFSSLPFFPRANKAGADWIGCWMGPQSRSECCEERKAAGLFRNWTPIRRYPTQLYWWNFSRSPLTASSVLTDMMLITCRRARDLKYLSSVTKTLIVRSFFILLTYTSYNLVCQTVGGEPLLVRQLFFIGAQL